MVNQGIAINLDAISVKYRLLRNRPTSIKEYFVRSLRGDTKSEDVMALDNTCLEISKGDVFGIIGRNGAGKTTLLKVIAGIVRPAHGRVRVWGRVVSLLGVGAGFHPELTGRENIHLYSAILGRSRKTTDDLINDIIRFAELQDFIDSPLRVYSSGMTARLGFAVAMAERPEILLVDEVLSVGDEKFQDKCRDRFTSFQEAGTTIVIVSHSMRSIESMCSKAVWLVDGRIGAVGDSDEVVAQYREYLAGTRHADRIRPA